MVRIPGDNDEKPLFWIGSSLKDLKNLPEEVQNDMGAALSVAQFGGIGGTHPHAKPWKGEGPGVFEVVEDFNTDTFRAVYIVKFSKAVYGLHVFQKKSPSGRETAAPDKEIM